ncbi:MAG: sigma-70 family RNA polymerase sigma factor [Salinivirgaceae bacterium]|nr:sigma-70 family RNA polymerase sigma factor [Salinivirgaceae bacterium]
MANRAKDKKIITLMKSESSRDVAFGLLVSEYSERLYWHIRKMILNHDDTDDVLQNTFIKVFQAFDSFRGDSSLFTWLYRIATNETLTFLDKKKRQISSTSQEFNDYLIDNLQSDSEFSGDEIQRKLQLAVQKLPEKQRLVFNMKYFDDLKFTEISEIVGTSVGGLKASYHHAVKKIEEYMLE